MALTAHQKRVLAFRDRCQTDPVWQIAAVQGFRTLLEKQKQIVAAIPEYGRVGVKSCHGIGKSTLASKVVCWFTPSFPDSKCITTAPTARQVREILWAYIHTAHSQAAQHRAPGLGGELQTMAWRFAPEWFAIGMTARKEAGRDQSKGSSMQGWHAKRQLFVLEEATGLEKQIWDQIEGMSTGGIPYWLAIANPTTMACEFYRIFSSPLWKTFTLSCFDSPNLPAAGLHNLDDVGRELEFLHSLDKDDQLLRLQSYPQPHAALTSAQFVMGRALVWGLQHPLFLGKVLAEFPETDEFALVTLGDVERCEVKYQREKEEGKCPKPSDGYYIGVDVARFGMDRTVIEVLNGHRHWKMIRIAKRDTATVTSMLAKLIRDLPNEGGPLVCSIDSTGIGSGVYDGMAVRQRSNELPRNLELREVHFGSSPTRKGDQVDYANLKAQLYVETAADLKHDLTFPEVAEFRLQWPMLRYEFDTKDRYKIESKEKFKERTGLPSPDESEALMLANYGRKKMNASGTFRRTEQRSRPRTAGWRNEQKW